MECKLQQGGMHNLSANCKASDCHYDLHLEHCGRGGQLQLQPATCTPLQKMTKRSNLQPPRWRRQSLKKQPHDNSCQSMSIWLLTMSQFISFPFTPSREATPLQVCTASSSFAAESSCCVSSTAGRNAAHVRFNE